VLALICALLVAIFAVQNAKPVVVAFLVWQFKISLVLVILGTAALGAAAAFLLGTVRLIRQSRRLKEADLCIERLEFELVRLQKSVKAKEGNKLSATEGENGQ
jgi:putative membrane protein